MNGEIRIDTRPRQKRAKGFPLRCFIRSKGKKKEFTFKGFYFELDQWDFDANLPTTKKADIIFVTRKKSQLDELLLQTKLGVSLTMDDVKAKLLGIDLETVQDDPKQIDYYKEAENIIFKLRERGKTGNARVYDIAIKEFKRIKPELMVSDITASFIDDFKQVQFKKGNKKNTINNYLRTNRAIYNQIIDLHEIEIEKNPFKGVFKGITIKKNRTKKKHLLKEGIKLLELIENLPKGQQESADLWLLEFYLGGLDFYDLYYLKWEYLVNNRVYMVRGKLDDGGFQFDIKIFPKAQEIFDKYSTKEGEYVFPWRKSEHGYRTFKRRVDRNLKIIQNKINKRAEELEKETGLEHPRLEVQPLGGNLGHKVARHSFATIAKHLFIETSIVKEIQGHELDDINSVYSASYPQEIRDEAHRKIIY